MDLQKIYREAELLAPEIIAVRRDLHHYAETAWTEFRTSSIVAKHLMNLGLTPLVGQEIIDPAYVWGWPGEETVHAAKERALAQGADPALLERMGLYPGVYAVIETGKPGPVIALRFDIDCNDVEELKDESHLPYREGFASVNPRQMHACGHDGHTAVGLAVASLLMAHSEELKGTVKLIFQPSEEGDRGSSAIIAKGFLDDADVVLAAHIYDSPDEKLGFAGTQTGLFATTKFDLIIHGRSAHAGFKPEDGASAIQAACLAVAGMPSFLQDGRGMSRLNVGTIVGGTGRNVVAEQCTLRCETRGSNTEVEQRLYKKVIALTEGICAAYGCTLEVKLMGVCPTGDGDLDLAAELVETCRDIPDFAHLQTELKQSGGTDDFSNMMNTVRGHGGRTCYMGLLTPLKAGHHNAAFDFDEAILPAGVKAFVAAVNHLMG